MHLTFQVTFLVLFFLFIILYMDQKQTVHLNEQQKIFTYSVTCLRHVKETTISSCLYLSMQIIEMSRDLDSTCRLSSQHQAIDFLLLTIAFCLTPHTFHYDVMYTHSAPWRFQHFRYKSNILFFLKNN